MKTREQKLKDIKVVENEIRLIKSQANPFLDALLKASGLEEEVRIGKKFYLAG